MIHAIFTFILLIILLGLVLVHYGLKYIQTERNEIRSAKYIRILAGSIFVSLIILTFTLGYNLYENYDQPQDWVSVVSINLSIVVWFVVLYFYYNSFKFKYKYQIVME